MGQAEKKSALYSIRLLKGNLNNVCRRQVYFLRKRKKQFTLIFFRAVQYFTVESSRTASNALLGKANKLKHVCSNFYVQKRSNLQEESCNVRLFIFQVLE